MRRTFYQVLLIAFALGTVSVGGGQAVTNYVQLIRATNQDDPENATWKPIGLKLRERLCPVFRWKNYWEVDRKVARMEPGKVSKTVLGKICIVEMELVSSTHSEIRIFRDGKLISKARRCIDSPMWIAGGDRSPNQAWFVV